MNIRQTLEALLAGKKVRRRVWSSDRFVYLEEKILNENGVAFELLLSGEFDLWEEPNPHAKGTYFWAFEEHLRGNKVKVCGVIIYSHESWPTLEFTHEDFVSKDWEVVP